MTLITPADLITAHGPRELAQITTPEGVAALDPALLEATLLGADRAAWPDDQQAAADLAAATIAAALEAANAMTARVAAGRLLSDAEERLLATHATDIARYRLYDDATLLEDNPIRRRFEAAVRFLERVAAGTETLGTEPIGTSGLPQSAAPERLFSRDTLADY